MLQVFKFGGASICNAEAVRNLVSILNNYRGHKLIVVLSAIGKSTNALEAILQAARNRNTDTYHLLFEEFRSFHFQISKELFTDDDKQINSRINNLFEQLHMAMHDGCNEDYDFHYDQTVCFGELLSTAIVSAYLSKSGIDYVLIDARDYVITDNHHRSANVDWASSCDRIRGLNLKNNSLTMTQGFISATKEKVGTTLGREGSDYTAAIFAYCLQADEVVIWKDVDGLLNADPKRFDETIKLEHISYAEAIELAYYGATVIHPKTIKPLQNKRIPLKVQSFANPKAKASLISHLAEFDTSVPSFIVKDNQMLVSISPHDFSFMTETNLHNIFGVLSKLNIHVNLFQTSAISLSFCADFNQHQLDRLFEELHHGYALRFNTGLQLLTIRHYTEAGLKRMSLNKPVLLEQRSRTTVQLVLRTKASQ